MMSWPRDPDNSIKINKVDTKCHVQYKELQRQQLQCLGFSEILWWS